MECQNEVSTNDLALTVFTQKSNQRRGSSFDCETDCNQCASCRDYRVEFVSGQTRI